MLPPLLPLSSWTISLSFSVPHSTFNLPHLYPCYSLPSHSSFTHPSLSLSPSSSPNFIIIFSSSPTSPEFSIPPSFYRWTFPQWANYSRRRMYPLWSINLCNTLSWVQGATTTRPPAEPTRVWPSSFPTETASVTSPSSSTTCTHSSSGKRSTTPSSSLSKLVSVRGSKCYGSYW